MQSDLVRTEADGVQAVKDLLHGLTVAEVRVLAIEALRRSKRQVRVDPRPGEPRIEGKALVSSIVVEISRKHADDFRPIWGEFRTDEEQRREQREMIAFELSLLQNALNPQGYNIDNHRGDYHDSWLLAYLAAGYYLVTRDGRLRSALRNGGCDDPRVIDVGAGLDLVEAWLAAEGPSGPPTITSSRSTKNDRADWSDT